MIIKIGSDCSGECCVCGCAGFCLAGHGDDDYFLASEDEIIKRLDNHKYPKFREFMIDTLLRVYGYSYEDGMHIELENKSPAPDITNAEVEELFCD